MYIQYDLFMYVFCMTYKLLSPCPLVMQRALAWTSEVLPAPPDAKPLKAQAARKGQALPSKASGSFVEAALF